MADSIVEVAESSTDPNQELPLVAETDEDAIDITNEICCRFICAVLAGDEQKAMRTYKINPLNIFQTRIGKGGETAFHMAVLAAKEKNAANVVITILSFIGGGSKFLEFASFQGTNALHCAAASGNREIVRIIHEKNPDLANTSDNLDYKPIILAAIAGHSDVIKFLLENTTFAEDDHNASSVLKLCIKSGLFDIAADMVQNHCPFAATWDSGDANDKTALELLAGMPSPVDKKQCTSFEKLLNQIWPILKNSNLYRSPPPLEKLLFSAARMGNHEVVVYLLGHYPGLIFSVDDSYHTVFHIAVVYRHEQLFSLIDELGSVKHIVATCKDINGNSLLHLAAELSPLDKLSRIPGVALQMQREFAWYKEVEKVVPPAFAELENSSGKTPHAVFVEKHLKLMISGEKWMKETTQFFMIVTTLVATVVFTAAFTIPGGINDNGGANIRRTKLFDIFAISEIVAMIFSSISMVMYVGILPSRYSDKGFLKYLPMWLTMGSISLFVSLSSMLVAFCSALLVFSGHDKPYMPILLGFLALAPLMFIGFNFPLLADILKTIPSPTPLSRVRRKLFLRDVA